MKQVIGRRSILPLSNQWKAREWTRLAATSTRIGYNLVMSHRHWRSSFQLPVTATEVLRGWQSKTRMLSLSPFELDAYC